MIIRDLASLAIGDNVVYLYPSGATSYCTVAEILPIKIIYTEKDANGENLFNYMSELLADHYSLAKSLTGCSYDIKGEL